MKTLMKLFTISCMIFALIKMCEAEKNIDKAIKQIEQIHKTDTINNLDIDTCFLSNHSYRYAIKDTKIKPIVKHDTIHNTVYMLQSPQIPNPYPQDRVFNFDTLWDHQNFIQIKQIDSGTISF